MLAIFSVLFDIYAILFQVSGLPLLFTILIALLKAPIYFTFSNKLRERGGELSLGQGSWGCQGLPGGGASVGAGNRAEQGSSSRSRDTDFIETMCLSRLTLAPLVHPLYRVTF